MGREVVLCYRESDHPNRDESAYRTKFLRAGYPLLDYFPKHSTLANCEALSVLKSVDGMQSASRDIDRFISQLG